MITFEEIAKESHATALEKGWWQDGFTNDGYPKRSFAEQVANFHAEISEAWECYRSGQMVTWIHPMGSGNVSVSTPGKPEGFWIEIADLLIRMGDTAGAYKMKFSVGAKLGLMCEDRALNVPEAIEALHYEVSLLVRERRRGYAVHALNSNFLAMFDMCCDMAMHHKVNLEEEIRLKLAYNKSRPYRHGGKKA